MGLLLIEDNIRINDIDEVSGLLWELFPQWLELEDGKNEFEVAPIVGYVSSTEQEKKSSYYDENAPFGPVYIRTHFLLNNKTKLSGFIRYNGEVTMISIFIHGKNFSFNLIPIIQQTLRENSETFAHELGMALDELFPIIYCSTVPCRGRDRLICGVIEK